MHPHFSSLQASIKHSRRALLWKTDVARRGAARSLPGPGGTDFSEFSDDKKRFPAELFCSRYCKSVVDVHPVGRVSKTHTHTQEGIPLPPPYHTICHSSPDGFQLPSVTPHRGCRSALSSSYLPVRCADADSASSCTVMPLEGQRSGV